MSTDNQQNQEKETAVEKKKPTYAERFVGKVEHEFNGAVGHGVEFTDNEKQLASNLFMKIDSALKAFESDRHEKSSKPAYTWGNINMQQLAIDAVHRVRLGLDALIDNHIHPIPYLNGKTGKYDLDLQIGYRGMDYYRKKVALEEIDDIRYELVHENDDFTQIKKDRNHEKDTYEFNVTKPFDRGEVVGGFGYITYKDERKNKLVTVSEKDFKKSEDSAPCNSSGASGL
ncbi:recombinase RecT [Fodinibius sp.]|uniref:recombinase RecT n=1 Tax=Fodinibius sp. TaxID=1872440 RepID=UPI002ACEDAAB|nr:recombinase RecT [Fodinibius sp.]MDZ7658034.1 recombinase RecT [Fodinibius sp.]